MRLSNYLCQINYHRHFKRVWKRQNRFQVKELIIPPELQEMGVQIRNAVEILDETKLFKPIPEKDKNLFPKPPSVYAQGKYYYLMHGNTQVTESENQVLALTKTLPYQGLPASVISLIGVDSFPNQDQLVKDLILQAQVWDADQEMLPKKVDLNRPGFNFRRHYGITYEKKVASLLEKMTYLCDGVSGKYARCLQRNKFLDTLCETSFEQNGEQVIFQLPCEILLTSDQPLQNFASPEEVAKTVQTNVPNIYPIKPTLDLDKMEEMPLLQKVLNMEFNHVHTVFVAQKSCDMWLPRQLLARSIATCFAALASEARKRFGANVKELPQPIAAQCVTMDIRNFNFFTYQLNTLDLNCNDGIKNQVWIDQPSPLYDEVSEETLITNYNPNIFPKFLAFYMNGLHTTL